MIETETQIPTRDRVVDAVVADATIKGPDGKTYMRDAKGGLMPVERVRDTDKLEDQMVRKLLGYALDLNAQIARFKNHCHGDVAAFLQLLAEQYGTEKGGKKGNLTLTSYDGTMKVQVAVADRITFGAELQIAKQLIDECIAAWSDGARSELRALVNEAFNTEKEGEVSRDAMFRLMRVQIEDERWLRAMQAIRDSIRVTGSKSYVRFYRRPSPEANWEAVSIDLAAA